MNSATRADVEAIFGAALESAHVSKSEELRDLRARRGHLQQHVFVLRIRPAVERLEESPAERRALRELQRRERVRIRAS